MTPLFTLAEQRRLIQITGHHTRFAKAYGPISVVHIMTPANFLTPEWL
jgi:hypothetical protein